MAQAPKKTKKMPYNKAKNVIGSKPVISDKVAHPDYKRGKSKSYKDDTTTIRDNKVMADPAYKNSPNSAIRHSIALQDAVRRKARKDIKAGRVTTRAKSKSK